MKEYYLCSTSPAWNAVCIEVPVLQVQKIDFLKNIKPLL